MRPFKKMTREEAEAFLRDGLPMPTSIMAVPYNYKKLVVVNCSNCRAVLGKDDSTCDNCGTEL